MAAVQIAITPNPPKQHQEALEILRQLLHPKEITVAAEVTETTTKMKPPEVVAVLVEQAHLFHLPMVELTVATEVLERHLPLQAQA